jgi:hypothetical protein
MLPIVHRPAAGYAIALFFLPEDQPRVMAEFFPAVLTHGHGELDIRFRNFKTGATRWMAYKVLTLVDASGAPAPGFRRSPARHLRHVHAGGDVAGRRAASASA